MLEGVSPVDTPVRPVAASSTAAGSRATTLWKHSKVVTSLATPGAEVRRVVPEKMSANTHARREKVPDIPLTQQDALTMEVAAVNESCAVGGTGPAAGRTGRRAGSAFITVTFEVRADID